MEPNAPPATSVVQILSGEGGAFEAPEAIRAYVCYTSESLLVDASKRYDPGVQYYLNRLSLKGVGKTPQYVTAERIAEMNRIGRAAKTNTTSGGVDISSQQRQVIARITEAQKMDASDIHLVCSHRDGLATFKYRVNGDLIEPPNSRMSYEEGQAFTNALYNTMCDVAQAFFKPNQPQDARFKPETLAAVGVYGARVATRPTDSGFLMVLRLLKAADDDLRLEKLGYLDVQVQDLTTIMDHSYGLCLFSGPTGSGKSRTLQTMLSLVVERTGGREHILTFEQPCEYEIRGANQTPVEVKTDPSTGKEYADFAGAIKNAMRLDPDSVMLGEVRDHESAVAVVEAAQTGHMVYSTVHANGAFEIPARLIGEPIALPRERVLDPTVMKGMIGQRLVQLLCPKCSIPLSQGRDTLKSGLYARLERVLSPLAIAKVRLRGNDPSCQHCGGRGTKGRQVVAEVVRTNLKLFTIFETQGHVAARKEWIEKLGGISMKMHALLLVAQGRVDPTDAEASVDLLDEEIEGLGIEYPLSVAGFPIFRQPSLKVVGGSSH